VSSLRSVRLHVSGDEAGDPDYDALITGFLARREEALAMVYRLYSKALYATAQDILRDPEDAQDCVHDVLVNVWTRRGSFRPELGSLRTFLIVCVRNAAMTKRRSTARRRAAETEMNEQERTTEGPDDHLAIMQLRAAIKTLPPEQLRTLTLAFFGQRTHVEIARELNLPLGTVKSRLALAIKRLRAHI
jgi:RNA polymerase sigma-70 factor (ECF subfamily)